MYTIVLMRHGESEWNFLNRFTGWVDSNLSSQGVLEAVEAGKLLKKNTFEFDVCFTSLLKRSIKTANLVLEECDQLWIQQKRSWRLNERMYGGLEGMNKAECVEKYGSEQVLEWRRSFDIPPPQMDESNEFNHTKERKYSHIDGTVPLTECLKDCIERVVPFFENSIVPVLKTGKKVLIVAHGNSLRGLVKHLDSISNKEIVELNIPTGIPLVYTLDEDFKPVQSKDKDFKPLSGVYLGDQDEVKKRIAGVANQTAKKTKS